MDSFRIYSICKLIADNPALKDGYKVAAVRSALRKCNILLEGAKKSGNNDFRDVVKDISEWLNQGSCSSRDFSILLNI
jgi:hypothetical protein